MDNYAAATTGFKALFRFLYKDYFPRVVFRPVYLSEYKTFVFVDNLELLGFQGSAAGLRPSIKHREKI